MYLRSLEAIGIDLREHDIRFEEDNWESPTLGAWGIGWQVLLDGLEITQFTYFQQSGGIDLDPISVEITYGLERICAFLQDVESVYDIRWTPGVTYGQIRLAEEQQLSEHSFDKSDASRSAPSLSCTKKKPRNCWDSWKDFGRHADQTREARWGRDAGPSRASGFTGGRACECGPVTDDRRVGQGSRTLPAARRLRPLPQVFAPFSLMDARGVISTTERAALMQRVRTLACRTAAAYLHQIGGKDNVGVPTKLATPGYPASPRGALVNPLWSPRARLSLSKTQPSHESGQWEPSSRSQLSGQLHNRKSGGTAGALQNVGARTKNCTPMLRALVGSAFRGGPQCLPCPDMNSLTLGFSDGLRRRSLKD